MASSPAPPSGAASSAESEAPPLLANPSSTESEAPPLLSNPALSPWEGLSNPESNPALSPWEGKASIPGILSLPIGGKSGHPFFSSLPLLLLRLRLGLLLRLLLPP